jgi:amino acid adenylation domain-containing protein
MTDPTSSSFQASPVQQWLWDCQPGAVPVAQLWLTLARPLDGRLLADALDEAVTRHEILRTTLTALPGGAVAQVVADAGTPLRIAALADDTDGGEVAARDRAALDAGAGPAFLATLATRPDGRQELILTAHAAIADLASLRLLSHELSAGYGGGEGGVAEDGASTPAGPLQYADFAAWHQDLLSDPGSAPDRLVWAGYATTLREAAPPAAWSAGAAEPATSAALSLDAGLTGELEAFAGARDVSVASLLAAAFTLTCQRFGGERDIVVDVAVPGRGQEAVREAIGAFERLVPAAGPADPDQTAAEFVAAFHAAVTDRADRVDYLDPALLAAVAPAGRDAARLGFRYSPPPQPAAGAISVDGSRQHASLPEPTWLEADHRGDHIAVTVHRAAGPPSAAALAESFEILLRDLLRRPEVPAGQLKVLSAGSREQLLARGRGPAASATLPCVHEAFAASAARSPAALAVAMAHGGEDLSYAELDARANQLARYLAARGAGRGERVVISLDRTPDLLVAVLGVLKAGAAFVPVDPAHPRERLVTVLQDSGAALLLTTGSLTTGDRGAGLPAPAVALDTDWPDIETQPATAPEVAVDPADPAYVLYTSGTTGTPNGVVVPHRGLANYLSWCVDAYDMAGGTGALTHSSISFDFTLTTLLGPLLAERPVIMAGEDGVGAVAATLRSRRGLSVLKLTPTHLDILGQLLTAAEIEGAVRTLVVGGEALDARAVELFRAAGARVVNEYGPTETVVGSIAHVMTDASPSSGPVPIGVPIAGTRVYLLGSHGDLVPDGGVGEICIGGAGVSLGYLHRPELTARRFVPELGGPAAALMYRTGDLGRWRSDGELEYLGRIDEQVKVNGIRVEPAEIEAALLACDGVAQAAVVVHRDEDLGAAAPLTGVSTIAAYVVPARGRPQLSHEVLADRCRALLPEQLVPRVFVTLEALPVTVNGKLDRAALPRPDVSARPGTDFVAPRTETEEVLAGAIATVLGRDLVGIDDNYFVLGGDSIRSVMVASRAQARGVDVTVADLHAQPSVRRLAERVTQRGPQAAGGPATEPFSLIGPEDRALVPANVEDAFPLNLLQEGMIFHRDFAAKSAVYHAIASLRLRAPYVHDIMRTAIDQLVSRHPMLRTSFDMTTFSRPMELVHTDFESPLHLEDLRDQPAEQREARVRGWIAEEKARGFELYEFPLIRFMVQRLTDEEWQFTYGFHHEIVDGWSEALMITELFSHYFSLVYDEPISIRPPTSTMRDAVALELEALEDKENYEFWDAYLADATVMRLPRFGAGLKADKGARDIVRVEVPVSAELSDKVKRLALASAVPLKNILMAAHMAVMSTYGGNADTLTYTVGNGRPESADGSTAIGLFVNSLALRVSTAGGSWRDLITAGLESERASMPYRRLPMAELKRHQGSEPLAETLFFFTNYHVFGVLDRWTSRGVSHVATDLYGESTFPFCAINRLNRETGQLEIRLEYDSLQFSAELMDGIRESYAQALDAITTDPDARYDTRSFAPAADLDAVRRACWGPATTPSTRCLHELIEEQARLQPDAAALDRGGATISYRELNRRANQVATLLRARGVGPGQVVGVLAERSVEQLVSILAVLKAGGAYLPLDPALSAERIAALVADARSPLVVAQQHLAGQAPAEVPVISLDPALTAAAGQPDRDLGVTVDPASAAYVIYTSGSTGTPKGVVIEHRNVVASTLGRRAYDRQPGRFLLLSSFAFDSSVAGIFWTLTQGGTLLLPADGLQREPAALTDLIAAQRPTHTLGIPSLLKLVLDQAGEGQLESLRVVVSAGEPCPAELAASFADRLPDCSFHNEYGPTEGTVWATKWSWQPGTDLGLEGLLQVPIGNPVPGGWVLPLSHSGQLVPVGVTGELHIGGAGVARGYLHRPAETADSFRPDARAGRPGARCYATGDLGRVLPEGVLEFQGRGDHQVKIQGFRVELGAIEALLDAHPAIQRSIVIARGSELGDRALVGYVVPRPGASVDPAQVRQYVRDRLPKYMVPAAVVVMDTVPLTATGKVDRAALPAVSYSQLAGDAEYVAPRNDIEEAIAAIWCKVLQLDRVGMNQLFFDLGGESLRAMQVIAATNDTFATALSVRQLFGAATVGELAAEVARSLAGEVAEPADSGR